MGDVLETAVQFLGSWSSRGRFVPALQRQLPQPVRKTRGLCVRWPCWMFPFLYSNHRRKWAEVMEGAETGQDLMEDKRRGIIVIATTHLVGNHSKCITIRLLSWLTVLLEQQLGTHPTECPRRGNHSCRQRDRVEVNRNRCKTKVCKEGGAVVVNENVCLIVYSAIRKARLKLFMLTPLRSPWTIPSSWR